MKIAINIVQGKTSLNYANINIIIDVIRAFTVSFYAFYKGVREIILVKSEKEALSKRKKYDDIILSGEINGYKIKTFDFGNSPYEIFNCDYLQDKRLIQKTTNGVNVTLASLNADNIFVTGYVNIYTLIKYIRLLIENSDEDIFKINIIASHPTGEDDLACAHYIRDMLLHPHEIEKKYILEKTAYSILNSKTAKKFLSSKIKDFSILDLLLSLQHIESDFVIKVEKENEIKLKRILV